VANAGSTLHQAVEQLREYQKAHPGSAPNPADPTDTQLSGNVAQAQQQYSLANQDLAQAQSLARETADAISSSDVTGVPKLLDGPAGVVKTSLKKAYVLGTAGSLLGGGTISALVLAILMASDKSARKESDIEDLLDLRVVGAVEDLSGRRWRATSTKLHAREGV
jgi:capsular polysaccharide biosynthesis protein